MAQRIFLTLTGRQRDESGEETVTAYETEADYYEKDGSRYILYEERLEGADEITKNIIKLKDSVLEMTKRGSIHSRMLFEIGKEHMAEYITPYGTLHLEITTKKSEAIFQDRQAQILLEYTLTSGVQFLSDCTLSLSLRFS